jgi:hypothetical protein
MGYWRVHSCRHSNLYPHPLHSFVDFDSQTKNRPELGGFLVYSNSNVLAIYSAHYKRIIRLVNGKNKYPAAEDLSEQEKAFINFIRWRVGERGHALTKELLYGAWLWGLLHVMDFLGLLDGKT